MKKNNITLSLALAAIFSASTAFAEVEVSGKIVHESAAFTKGGSVIGADNLEASASGYGEVSHPHGATDTFKRETSARIYIDGEADSITDGATYHVELNLMTDGKGIGKYDGNESYTQRDALREAYVDAEVNDWSIRAGKQQVVWGTADGMKLLDMINPTDYQEMAQNQMEDSRIPVWMINAEMGDNQIIVSQPKENIFAGLNRGIDTAVKANATTPNAAGAFVDLTLTGTNSGIAFVMKGPDTITGQKNGFLNIVPDLGSVARAFASGFGGIRELSAGGMSAFKVDSFEALTMGGNTAASMAYSMGLFGGSTTTGMLCDGSGTVSACTVSSTVLNTNYDSDSSAATWNYTDLPDNFEANVVVVGSALGIAATDTAALNAITGVQMLAYGFAPSYNTILAKYGSDTGATATTKDSVFDWMGQTTFKTFNTFVNAKSQYVYDMPESTDMDIALRRKGSTADGINYSLNASYNYDKNPIINLGWYNDAGENLLITEVDNGMGGFDISLATAAGQDYSGNAQGTTTSLIPTLRFTQTVERVKNLGGSFDMAIETEKFGPVVIRGEALYTKGGYAPIINTQKLGIGNLVAALQMKKADRFKYVLGADITVMTNMMVSAQIIQDRNLDFVDNGTEFTSDYATMHLTNGFNKAQKDKEFYSLFMSKPFGASGEHRWNNIFMYEDQGGKWNRLDAEFSIDDDTQVTVEMNSYFGNEDTQFGQLKNSSNIQAGFKYSF
jgi:hypothetical protein